MGAQRMDTICVSIWYWFMKTPAMMSSVPFWPMPESGVPRIELNLEQIGALAYLVNEVVSIIENCAKAGIPIPSQLVDALAGYSQVSSNSRLRLASINHGEYLVSPLAPLPEIDHVAHSDTSHFLNGFASGLPQSQGSHSIITARLPWCVPNRMCGLGIQPSRTQFSAS